MQAYEIVRLDRDGREITRREMHCIDEEEALDRIAALNHRFGLELWTGDRLVCHWGPALVS
jgi:hypothetical protein